MRQCIFVIVIIGFITPSGRAAAQTDSASALGVAAASLVPAACIGAIVVLNQDAFWRYATEVPFHISNDPPYAMHIDKFSHFYMSSLGSDGMRSAYQLAGLSEQTSVWLGASLTFVGGFAIEMEDARHGDDPQYGFSPGDLAGDLIGSSMPVLRHYYPVLNRLETKISLWPSNAYKAGQYNTIADDYESQYYWLSMDLHGWTPLPQWLNLAFGFGCENLFWPKYSVPSPYGAPYTDAYFSPDINLKGLPIDGAAWNTIASILSYVRIPLPALQFYPRIKFWAFR